MWGGKHDKRVIHWITWDTVLAPLDEGGLGVGSLKAANYGHLGKWWWRFKHEKNALWVKVIKSIYGRDGGLEGDLRASSNGVWADVIKAGHQLDASGIIFTNSFKRIAGNGQKIQLWKDKRALDCELASVFPRLFALEDKKNAMSSDRGCWVNGKWSWNWLWRREPRVREAGELQNLSQLLQTISLQERNEDAWEWMHSDDGALTVASLTKLADQQFLKKSLQQHTTQWNNFLLRKINIFIWRAMQDRLPSHLQLAIRGINLQSVECPRCNCTVEDLDHAIAECPTAARCWTSLFAWCDCYIFERQYVLQLLSTRIPPYQQPFKESVAAVGCNKKGVRLIFVTLS